jgi:hypothetical protein
VIERITLRRITPRLGFADVRLTHVHLCDLRVEQRGTGGLQISPPVRTDGKGRRWPCYALQPGTREAIEAEIAVLWERAAGQ